MKSDGGSLELFECLKGKEDRSMEYGVVYLRSQQYLSIQRQAAPNIPIDPSTHFPIFPFYSACHSQRIDNKIIAWLVFVNVHNQ